MPTVGEQEKLDPRQIQSWKLFGEQSGAGLCQIACAAITKYHKLGALNNSHLLSHSSGGWTVQIRLVGLDPFEGCEEETVQGLSPSFWWFAGHPGCCSMHRLFYQSLPSSSHGFLPIPVSVSTFYPSLEVTSHIGLGPTLMNSF